MLKKLKLWWTLRNLRNSDKRITAALHGENKEIQDLALDILIRLPERVSPSIKDELLKLAVDKNPQLQQKVLPALIPAYSAELLQCIAKAEHFPGYGALLLLRSLDQVDTLSDEEAYGVVVRRFCYYRDRLGRYRHDASNCPNAAYMEVEKILLLRLRKSDHKIKQLAIGLLGEIGFIAAIRPLVLEFKSDEHVLASAAKDAIQNLAEKFKKGSFCPKCGSHSWTEGDRSGWRCYGCGLRDSMRGQSFYAGDLAKALIAMLEGKLHPEEILRVLPI